MAIMLKQSKYTQFEHGIHQIGRMSYSVERNDQAAYVHNGK